MNFAFWSILLSPSRHLAFMKERRPIFYDEEKVRWRRTRRALEVSGVLLTLLIVYFFVTVAGSVELPSSLILCAGRAS